MIGSGMIISLFHLNRHESDRVSYFILRNNLPVNLIMIMVVGQGELVATGCLMFLHSRVSIQMSVSNKTSKQLDQNFLLRKVSRVLALAWHCPISIKMTKLREYDLNTCRV